MPHDCLEIQAGASQMDLVNKDHSGSNVNSSAGLK